MSHKPVLSNVDVRFMSGLSDTSSQWCSEFLHSGSRRKAEFAILSGPIRNRGNIVTKGFLSNLVEEVSGGELLLPTFQQL